MKRNPSVVDSDKLDFFDGSAKGSVGPAGEDSKQPATKDERFLDKEGLRKKLSLPSTRNVDEMMRAKRIPYLRLGHRTVRFDWPKVEKALARFEVKEIGRIEEAA